MFQALTSDSKQQADSIKANSSLQNQDVHRAFDGSHALGMPPVAVRSLTLPALVSPRKQKLMRLQKAYGNQAVLRMLEHSRPAIQRKLAVNEPGDAYEQEADRVADQVMRMPDPELSVAAAPAQVSRKCAACEDEEKSKMLQAKAAGWAEPAASEAPPIVHEERCSPPLSASVGQQLGRTARATRRSVLAAISLATGENRMSVPQIAAGSVTYKDSTGPVQTSTVSSGGTAGNAGPAPAFQELQEGDTLQLTDIEPPQDIATATFLQIGNMWASFGYGSSAENISYGGGCPIDNGKLVAGLTTPAPPALRNISVTLRSGMYWVSANIDEYISYQVCSGLGPELQTDITSDSDPNITNDNFSIVAADLTPQTNGRPPRRKFWASDLTLKHELFHVGEWNKFAQSAGVDAAELFLGLQFASSVNDVIQLLQQVPKVFYDAVNRRMAPFAEDRAYADGAPFYQSRADAIRAKGQAGQYP